MPSLDWFAVLSAQPSIMSVVLRPLGQAQRDLRAPARAPTANVREPLETAPCRLLKDERSAQSINVLSR